METRMRARVCAVKCVFKCERYVKRSLYTSKETYKRDLQKRPTQEPYKRDPLLSKSAPATNTSVLGNICQKRPVYIKRDLQKRPTPLQISTCNQTHLCQENKALLPEFRLFLRILCSFGGIPGLNSGPSWKNLWLLGGEYRAEKLLPSRSAITVGATRRLLADQMECGIEGSFCENQGFLAENITESKNTWSSLVVHVFYM